MQNSVAKNSVELVREGKALGVLYARIQTPRSRGGNELGATINTDSETPSLNELFREHAITTSQVEDTFPGSR